LVLCLGCLYLNIRQDTALVRQDTALVRQDTALVRQAKLFICVLSLENKVDAFRSATPPFQLSEELKVCLNLVLYVLAAEMLYYIDQYQ